MKLFILLGTILAMTACGHMSNRSLADSSEEEMTYSVVSGDQAEERYASSDENPVLNHVKIVNARDGKGLRWIIKYKGAGTFDHACYQKVEAIVAGADGRDISRVARIDYETMFGKSAVKNYRPTYYCRVLVDDRESDR